MTAPSSASPVDSVPSVASSLALWRRYWLFGWLFEPCNQADPFRAHAALARNRERARLLPIYMRRYATLGALGLALSALSGPTGPMPIQAAGATLLGACLTGLIISGAIWLALRGPVR
jgi:hypothetical protein